jgi:hypothetical protein
MVLHYVQHLYRIQISKDVVELMYWDRFTEKETEKKERLGGAC